MVHGRRAWVVLSGVATAIAAGLLLLPTGTSQSCSASDGGAVVCTHGATHLLAVQGGGVIPVLLVPAVLCLAPVLLRRRLVQAFATAVLWLFCLMAGLSVGLFFLPVAVAALVLTIRSETRLAGVRQANAAAS